MICKLTNAGLAAEFREWIADPDVDVSLSPLLMVAAERLEAMEEFPSIAEEAIGQCRSLCEEGLGFNCTFVDDSAKVLVALAQRAVLAGLDSDAQEDMQRRFRTASEPHREAHEKALGHPISRFCAALEATLNHEDRQHGAEEPTA